MNKENKHPKPTPRELEDSFARAELEFMDLDETWYETRLKENPHKLPDTLEEWLAYYSLDIDEIENGSVYELYTPIKYHSKMVSTKHDNVLYPTVHGWTRILLKKENDSLILGWEVDSKLDMANGEFNHELSEKLETVENVHRLLEKWRIWVFRAFIYGEE